MHYILIKIVLGALVTVKILHYIYKDSNPNQLEKIIHKYPDKNQAGQFVNETDNIYTYDSAGRLETVKNTFDNGLHYYYDANGRVGTIKQYNFIESSKKLISKMDINYSFKKTVFTDTRGDKVQYTFDNYGHTINVIDDEGSGIFYKYENIFNTEAVDTNNVNYFLNHKIIEISQPQINKLDESFNNSGDKRDNLLNNSSLESDLNGWTTNSGFVRSAITTTEYSDILGNYGLKVNGNASSYKYISQRFSINGSSGDSFIFGGWAQGYMNPQNEQSIKYARIKVTIYEYIMSPIMSCNQYGCTQIGLQRKETPKDYYLNFNSHITEWQYLMNGFTATNPYTSIEFRIEYIGENTVYFDKLQLYREEFAKSYKYNGSGNITNINIPNTTSDVLVEYSSTNSNNVSKITTSDGMDIDYQYNTLDLLQDIQINNSKASLGYDSSTRLLNKVTTGSLDTFWFTSTTQYDATGQFQKSITDPFNQTIKYEYDILTGLLDALEDESNVRTDYEYDELGRMIKVSKNESENQYVYQEGQLKQIKIKTSVNQETNENIYKLIYEFEYDDFGKVREVFVNNFSLMSYQYDEYLDSISGENKELYYTDRLEIQTYGNNDSIKMLYNDQNQITFIQFKKSADLEYITRFEYVYDDSGQLKTYIDHINNETYSYQYDIQGRVKSITDNKNRIISFGYNERQELSDYNFNNNGYHINTKFFTDPTSGLYENTEINNNGKSIIVDYKYDTDVLQRLRSIDYIIGQTKITKTYDYDTPNSTMGNASTRVNKISYNVGEGYTYEYGFDTRGNIDAVIVKEGTSSEVTIEKYNYHYDDLNQIIREDIDTNTQYYSMEYVYDDFGNIIYKKQYKYKTSTDELTEEPTKIIKYTYDAIRPDQLSKVAEVDNTEEENEIEIIYAVIDYDKTGNPLDNQDYSYTWEGRELKTIINNSTDYNNPKYFYSIQYHYNDQGYRTYKKVNYDKNEQKYDEYNYYLDGDRVLYENISHFESGTLQSTDQYYYLYDQDGTIVGFSFDNDKDTVNVKEYYYIRNIFNDITKIVDVNGQVVVEYTYDAWGNVIDTIEYDAYGKSTALNLALKNPYRYRGYRYEVETGLYYLNSRYYNPEIGRFINADGLIGETGDILGHNMYAYCQNNSIMFYDPSGYARDTTFARLSHLLASGGNNWASYLPEGPVESSRLYNDIVRTEMNSGYNGRFDISSNFIGSNSALKGSSSIFAEGAGKANKPFVPDEYWSRNAPKNSTPGAKFDHYKNNNGVIERSTVVYDNYGRQQYRIDYNNHGYSDHSKPHLHEYKYGPGYEKGWEFRWDFWR